MIRRAGFAALIVLAVLASLAPSALAAKPKGIKTDLITIAPDFASFGVKSIAMLPIATFDRSVPAERMVADLWGQNFRATGYRWLSVTTARGMLLSTVGDSTVKAVREQMLKNARVDSLQAPLLCAKLRTRAVLCLRVDLWEQQPILWNQSGRPTTTVQLKAALVDSTGTLLWSASGGETGEGPHHDPSTNPIDVRSSVSKDNQPITGQGGPPGFEEVLNRLLLRWLPQFPQPAGAGEPAK
jgi:hypothetical protein